LTRFVLDLRPTLFRSLTCIRQVYKGSPYLQTKRQIPVAKTAWQTNFLKSPLRSVGSHWASFRDDTIFFYHQAVFFPAVCLALLFLTVFAFEGQMVSFLVSGGLNATQIGLCRSISVLVELSATWAAPHVMSRIGAVRSGIWFLNWQIVWVCLATLALWTSLRPSIAATGVLIGMIASRFGLWGYDLSAQILIQQVRHHCMRSKVYADSS